MDKNRSSFLRKLGKALFFLGLFSLPVLFWLNRFTIYDWIRLRDYTPPAEIVTIADKTTMVPTARRTFYAQHPKFDDKTQLSNDCHQSEFTIVLGCYVASRGIFLYQVPDPRLSGTLEVTGAHEMLHAAYDRLSIAERKRIDAMTAAAFAQVTDKRIKDTVAQYRQRDPSIVPNELHSILATEVRNLPSELETYYKKYFSDRDAIVSFSEQYEGEFTSRENKVKEYDAQLAGMKQQIEANQTELQTKAANLTAQRNELIKLQNAQNFTEYNSKVDGYNAQVAAYNNLASRTKTLVNQYNEIVNERNAVAVEVNDLAKAIDSRTQTLQTQ